MNYEKLKNEIKEIVEISQLVPESLREKCFELLLNHLLEGKPTPLHPKHKEESTIPESSGQAAQSGGVSSLSLPAAIKAFMRRTNTAQSDIEAIVMTEDGEFHFIKEPTHANVSKGQHDWALLLALRNGIQNNSLTVDPEAVRSIVQEKGFYDSANFAKNFKNEKYSVFYKGTMDAQGEARALTLQGEKHLAELIKSLAK